MASWLSEAAGDLSTTPERGSVCPLPSGSLGEGHLFRFWGQKVCPLKVCETQALGAPGFSPSQNGSSPVSGPGAQAARATGNEGGARSRWQSQARTPRGPSPLRPAGLRVPLLPKVAERGGFRAAPRRPPTACLWSGSTPPPAALGWRGVRSALLKLPSSPSIYIPPCCALPGS